MRTIGLLWLLLAFTCTSPGGQRSPVVSTDSTMILERLVDEAIANNPEIQGSLHQMVSTDALVPQAGALDPPELTFMREMMPDFRYNDAMYSRIGIMQMIPFPGKLSAKQEFAQIVSDHAHHEHMEKMFEIVSKVKQAYIELWFVQQSIGLNRENVHLLHQMDAAARIRYGVGETEQQDVLRIAVELAKTENQTLALRQQELSAKAMLMALLNRQMPDTLGMATLPPETVFSVSLSSLERMALEDRSMVQHDSVGVEQSKLSLSLARKEYLPDFKIGLERVTSPMTGLNGWTISAGITIPFAPWSLGKSTGMVDEAEAALSRSKDTYRATQNMVLSNVRDLYYKTASTQQQSVVYRSSILPRSRQALDATLTAYQNGRTSFLMLIDAYRTLVDLHGESLMVRMQFEQSVAQLEKEVGYFDFTRVE